MLRRIASTEGLEHCAKRIRTINIFDKSVVMSVTRMRVSTIHIRTLRTTRRPKLQWNYYLGS